MPRRPSIPDTSVGQRIRIRRQLHSWSVRYAADRAGISHSTWSRVERGLMACDNRYLVADIAAALECSVADLTGAPVPPPDRQVEAAQSRVHRLRLALVEADLADTAGLPTLSIVELEREATLLGALRDRCDYAGLTAMAPSLVRQLYAAAGPDRVSALRLLAGVMYVAMTTLKDLGHPAEAWLAAERCREAAEALDDPVLLGLAGFTRAHAAIGCGAYERGLTLAARSVDALAGHLDRPASLEVLGMLQLTCAYASRGLKRADDSARWVAEAADLAQRTGDTSTLGLQFGPTNVSFFRVAMETDGGEPGRALEIAQHTNPTTVATWRRVGFSCDTARALARVRKDQEAIGFLLMAERMAPQAVRSSPLVRETARSLLERSRREAAGTQLRGFCERLGLAT